MTYLGLNLGLQISEKTRNSSGIMVARDGVEPPTPAFSGPKAAASISLILLGFPLLQSPFSA